MKLEPIAEFLEQQGHGTRASSLFIHFMPNDRTGLLLRDPMYGSPLDHELPGFRKTSFQLISRQKDYSAAKTALLNAIATLSGEQERSLTGMAVKYMRQRHDPLPYPFSAGGFTELLVNIDVCYVLL